VTRHVVAAVADFPAGTRRRIEIDGRAIVVLNIAGEYFALLDRCPHKGGSLASGVLTGLVSSPTPGEYAYLKQGEILRCPWHGWEFDVRTGQSFCSGLKTRARPLPVHIAPGSDIVEGPYRAETFPVSVEQSYVVVDA